MNSDPRERAWQLHSRGYPPSRIARAVGMSADEARRAVTAVWRERKNHGDDDALAVEAALLRCRVKELEQLCLDMYAAAGDGAARERMEALGLLEGGE